MSRGNAARTTGTVKPTWQTQLFLLAPADAAQIQSPALSRFRYFHSSPEVIRLAVLMYVRFPLFLCNVEDLLFKRGIDVCHETVRFWWSRSGPLFAADIRRQRANAMQGLAALEVAPS